jgi:cardiolipin synthase
MCVIDGRIGYIGGMNIATRYVKGKWKKVRGKTVGQSWRDTHLRIQGGAVYGIQRAFLVDWYFVDRTLISIRRYYPEAIWNDGSGEASGLLRNNCIIQIVTSSPIAPSPDIMQGYVRILLEARHYVYMETPYFLPTEPILFAMRTAALSGVDVRLMVPLHVDSKLVEWASRSYLMEVIESGVHILFYRAGFNHSKLLVCDDQLSTCGSTNVDFRSFENNFESNLFVYDRDVALRMKAVFLDDETRCVRAEELSDIHNRPFHQRLWESLVCLLAPLL